MTMKERLGASLLPTLAQIIQDYFGNEPEVNRILEYFNKVI
jgi:hypothetical protein